MKKALRIIAAITIFVVIIAAIIISQNNKTSSNGIVWDQETTIGNPEAKNHFIIYSDLVCPYCIAFENAIVENEDAFKEYIEQNDILYEVRLSDFLYEYGEANPINSRYSAEAVYCAKKEGKFWDYYDQAVKTVWNDFFKELGKGAFTKMASLKKDYWTDIGKKIGLDNNFVSCVENDEPVNEIKENAKKTVRLISGMPYFKFNNYVSSGFDLSWGWDNVKMYFKAGLES